MDEDRTVSIWVTEQHGDLSARSDPHRRKQIGRGRCKVSDVNSSVSASESPMKRQCVIEDEFTDEDIEVPDREVSADEDDNDSDNGL